MNSNHCSFRHVVVHYKECYELKAEAEAIQESHRTHEQGPALCKASKFPAFRATAASEACTKRLGPTINDSDYQD